MRISEDIDKKGFFWLPRTPQEKIAGTLKISKSGEAEIETIGTFGGIKKLNDDFEIGRVIGVIEGGKLVTLEDCYYKNRNISFGGVSKSIFRASYVLIGVQYDEDDKIEFSSLQFSVEGIDEWLGVSGIKSECDWEAKTAIISYQPPESIQLRLSEDMELSFGFTWSLPFGGNLTEACITQKAYIKLSSSSLLSFEDFNDLMHKLKNFFCFVMDETVCVDSITAFSYNLKRKVDETREIEEPIKIYYPSFPYAESVPKVEWHSILLRYSHISKNLQTILVGWLESYNQIEPTFNLYFASKFDAHKYLEGKFLSLAHSLETFHRRTVDKTRLPAQEFNALTVLLLDNCPEAHRDWFRGVMKYSNELSLRKRLFQMFEPFKSSFGDKKLLKALINNIYNTRNYLTHYDRSLESAACEGVQLWELCMQMECLLQLHLLKKVGLSEGDINELVTENRAFKRKLTRQG